MEIKDAKQQLLEQVLELCLNGAGNIKIKSKADRSYLTFFIKHFFSGIPYNQLQKLQAKNLSEIIAQSWNFVQVRTEDCTKIYISTNHFQDLGTPRTLIHILNVDRSFIVNTIKNILAKHKLEIETIRHPVLYIIRDNSGQLIEINEAVHPDDNNGTYESVVCIQIKGQLSEEEIQKLQGALFEGLNTIRQIVNDWDAIKEKLQHLSTKLYTRQNLEFSQGSKKSEISKRIQPEAIGNLLKWLKNKHFIFLGARFFPAKSAGKDSAILCFDAPQDDQHLEGINSLGLFRLEKFNHNSALVPGLSRATYLPEEIAAEESFPDLNIVKTSLRSPVHRPSRLDSIEVVEHENGFIKGVWQFIGFLAKSAYTDSAFKIPLICNKVRAVFEKFSLQPQWYDGKTLFRIIDSIPRDELFQLREDQIYSICSQALELNEYGHLSYFLRQDRYGAYTVALVYLVRERYDYSLKDQFSQILEDHVGGIVTSSHTHMGDLPFVRMIFILSHETPKALEYCAESLQADLLEASLRWEDRLEQQLYDKYEENQTAYLYNKYKNQFPETYKEQFSAEEGMADIVQLELLSKRNGLVLSLTPSNINEPFSLKFYYPNEPLSLSKILPILQNLGIEVVTETPYCLKFLDKNDAQEEQVWIHACQAQAPANIDIAPLQENLIDIFEKVWAQEIENDSLNQLALKAQLTGHQIMILRSYTKYLKQIHIPYSTSYIEETLITYAPIAGQLVELFELKFTQPYTDDLKAQVIAKANSIRNSLVDVKRLEHEKILTFFLNVIMATVRTNYAQLTPQGQHKNYLSLKFDCRLIDDLPKPKPLYEIFVYSLRTEAVHLRGGKVARGGIRWSDRFEDYRTEILSLLKAQMVKNSVIVPLGAKGGFIVKRQEQFTDRTALMDEVISCYKIVMRAMLEITDSVKFDHKGKQTIQYPENVTRWDEDDPYLVVAADKGTATFSDIANQEAINYGFWLEDAFASGGSEGYDHKKMAITTRGAWESVKRHFRELKVDVQKEFFSAIGVGDMSGDVFGNGMLQSRTMLLKGAFNHQHIFIDPTPNAEVSFEERKRLFNLPRSTWADYNLELISPGGGVFSRKSKKIDITPEMKEAFAIHVDALSPDELIKAILTAPVDLIWFGGIGTFIKDKTENHFDVGDITNNNIRVNAQALKAQVITEGANLGMTQRARIAYALSGGRINTDAIDNSAGVDCSDHEVNIKILLKGLELSGKMDRPSRDELLRAMTDEVAQLVLRDNYLQTQILSLMEAKGSAGLPIYYQLMKILETEANLDLALEFLPDEEQVEKRRREKQGFTRPELAILLAYSKIILYNNILKSDLPDLSKYDFLLIEYFPTQLRKDYSSHIRQHLLKREIIATSLTNTLVNRMGPEFIYNIGQVTGEEIVPIVKSFFCTQQLLNLEPLWSQVEALDNQYITDVQLRCLVDINHVASQVVVWFLKKGYFASQLHLDNSVYDDLCELKSHLPDFLTELQRESVFEEINRYHQQGLGSELAKIMGTLIYYPALIDIVDLSRQLDENPSTIAQTYFMLSERLELQTLLRITRDLVVTENWQRAAQEQLIYDLMQARIKLTAMVLRTSTGSKNDSEQWYTRYKGKIDRFINTLNMLKLSTHADLAVISFVIRELEDLVESIK